MTRGNQREKAREKNLKDSAASVSRVMPIAASQTFQSSIFPERNRKNGRFRPLTAQLLQKKKNTQSGTEFARTKEQQAAIMREKQAKGWLYTTLDTRVLPEQWWTRY